MIQKRLLTKESSTSSRLKSLASGDINDEQRTVVLTFSSEEPVDRWFGREVLDHGSKAVRLSRMNNGGAFLLNHDRNQQIGVVLEASLEGKRGKALVKFSRSKLGEEAFQDVKDGIRVNVSTTYRYHEIKLEESKSEGPDTYRVLDWEPLEISLESIPADPTVGVGRGAPGFSDVNALEHTFPEELDPKGSRNEPTTEEVSPVPTVPEHQSNGDSERRRTLEILAMGDKFGKPDMARRAIGDGTSVDEFSRTLLESMRGNPEVPASPSTDSLGLTTKEARQFSFLKAMRAVMSGDWRGAEFEKEVSEATSARLKRTTTGFFVPSDVIMVSRADPTPLAATGKGGPFVATEIPPGSFIETLRSKLVIRQLGARVLSGLEGNLGLPRLGGGATAFWVAETTDVDELPHSPSQVPLSPKSVGAFTDLTRRLILQTSLDVEEIVREDLASAVAVAIDRAAVAGTGKDNQPTGILHTEGVRKVPLQGEALNYPSVVNLETSVAVENAAMGALGYLTNPRVTGILKTTLVNDKSSSFIWSIGPNGKGMVNGYTCESSTVVPDDLGGNSSALIFGNWNDLVIGEWGVLDVQVNPFLKGTSGTVRIRVLQEVDIAIRHGESFAYSDEIKTGTPRANPLARAMRGSREK